MHLESHIKSGIFVFSVFVSAIEFGQQDNNKFLQQEQEFSHTQLITETLRNEVIKANNNDELLEGVFKITKQQYRQMLNHSKDLKRYPRTSDDKDQTKYVPISDWAGGFWPGDTNADQVNKIEKKLSITIR